MSKDNNVVDDHVRLKTLRYDVTSSGHIVWNVNNAF